MKAKWRNALPLAPPLFLKNLRALKIDLKSANMGFTFPRIGRESFEWYSPRLGVVAKFRGRFCPCKNSCGKGVFSLLRFFTQVKK